MRYQSGSDRRAAAKLRCWRRSVCAALASAYIVSAETDSFLETAVVFFRAGFGLVEEEAAVDDFFLEAEGFLAVVELFLLLLLLFEAVEALVGTAAAGGGGGAGAGGLAAAAAPDAPVVGGAVDGTFPVLGAPELDIMDCSRFHRRYVFIDGL